MMIQINLQQNHQFLTNCHHEAPSQIAKAVLNTVNKYENIEESEKSNSKTFKRRPKPMLPKNQRSK